MVLPDLTLCNFAGGGGGMPGGAGGNFQSYQFHGDPFSTFSAFFGDEDPFASIFGDGGFSQVCVQINIFHT